VIVESYRTSHLGKGDDYHRTFSEQPYRALIWALERWALDRAVAAHAGAAPPRHLDFACGTGRILGHLAPRAAHSAGVDVSPTMLEEARRNAPQAELFEGDVTRDDTIAPGPFELITAFRFFPNAEPALRRDALDAMVHRLAPGGLLIFNNHLNAGWSTFRLMRLLRRETPHQMSATEVDELLSAQPLHVVGRIGLGLLPMTDRRIPLALPLLGGLERGLSHLPGAWALAHDVLYVCRRT
jgi:SAM-dependent methyltransferase